MKSLKIVMGDFIPNFWHFPLCSHCLGYFFYCLFLVEGLEGRRKEERIFWVGGVFFLGGGGGC